MDVYVVPQWNQDRKHVFLIYILVPRLSITGKSSLLLFGSILVNVY